MSTRILTWCFVAFALVACASEESRPVLSLSTNDVNPRSVRIHGLDAKQPNVMFRFRKDAPPHIYEFYRENVAKWIQVSVDGVLVCEKAGHAPIVVESEGRFVGYDIVVFSKEDAERVARALRGEKVNESAGLSLPRTAGVGNRKS